MAKKLVNAIDIPMTMTSLELVDFINASRNEGEAEVRHSDFLVKVESCALYLVINPLFTPTFFSEESLLISDSTCSISLCIFFTSYSLSLSSSSSSR